MKHDLVLQDHIAEGREIELGQGWTIQYVGLRFKMANKVDGVEFISTILELPTTQKLHKFLVLAYDAGLI